VYVDTPEPDSLRYVARRTAKGGFGWLLYQLALDGGLEQAQQVVVLGDGAPWIWNLTSHYFPQVICSSLQTVRYVQQRCMSRWRLPDGHGYLPLHPARR